MTRGQDYRRKRAIVLGAATLSGASVRLLGDVFDLDPGHVSRVARKARAEILRSPGGASGFRVPSRPEAQRG